MGFDVTETPNIDFDVYKEIHQEYLMDIEELRTTPIKIDDELCIAPPIGGDRHIWGENHINGVYDTDVNNQFPKGSFILDIGCGGGGFIETCVNNGHKAIGIEIGVGYQKMKSFAWNTIPDNLFIRDFGQPLTITYDGEPVKFDFIHSYDVFEHIKEDDIPQVFKNIVDHCKKETYIILKIANWKCLGHRTTYDRNWWKKRIKDSGLVETNSIIKSKLRPSELKTAHEFNLRLKR